MGSRAPFRSTLSNSYYPIAFESNWPFTLDAENPSDFPLTRTFVDVFAYDVTWKKDERLAAGARVRQPSRVSLASWDYLQIDSHFA